MNKNEIIEKIKNTISQESPVKSKMIEILSLIDEDLLEKGVLYFDEYLFFNSERHENKGTISFRWKFSENIYANIVIFELKQDSLLVDMLFFGSPVKAGNFAVAISARVTEIKNNLSLIIRKFLETGDSIKT